MTPYEAIISKRDIRDYTGEPIPDEVLRRVLQAGRMAGSSKNQQVNRLVVFRDQAVQDRLAEAGDFASWIGTAAAIIGIAAPIDALRMFDVGRMAQNMMVAAHVEGLASCPVTLHHQNRARAAAGLPDDWDMTMVITLGWPVADVPDSSLKRPRVPLDELVYHDRFG
jgi:nitroreductase